VAIESMAAGTPVIARRAGALTETIEDGVDGYLIDDLTEAALAIELVGELDRTEIRRRAIERFSTARMVDDYERVYHSLIEERAASQHPPLGPIRPTSNGSGSNAQLPVELVAEAK